MGTRKCERSLRPEDWCREALLAFGEEGEKALAIEPLARRMGVTKGSFYWHFRGRDELVQQALTYWRELGTTEVIQSLDSELDTPTERLRALFELALRDPAELRAEAALQAAAARGHPVIASVVAEVNRERLSFLVGQYRALRQPVDVADAAYAAYLGTCQLMAMRPSPLTMQRRHALVRELQERFVPTSS